MDDYVFKEILLEPRKDFSVVGIRYKIFLLFLVCNESLLRILKSSVLIRYSFSLTSKHGLTLKLFNECTQKGEGQTGIRFVHR